MLLPPLIDDALEIAVVPSFTRIGYEVRRQLFGWTPPPTDSLRGRTVLITGPTSGLGRAATDALAGLGARLILVGRSQERLVALRDELVRDHGEDRFRTLVADMADLGSARAAASAIDATEPRLDVVIDNAGAIFPERTTSPDGYRSRRSPRWSSGPFALVAGLLPLLRRTGSARVVAVTSGGHVRPAAPDRRPPVGATAVRWHAGVRPGQARAGLAHARMGAAHPGGRGVVRGDAPGLGRHARHLRRAARFLRPDGSAPADARPGRRHDRLARRRPGRGRRGRDRTPRSSIAGRARSTAYRRPVSPPPNAGGCGTWWSASPASRTRHPTHRPDHGATT